MTVQATHPYLIYLGHQLYFFIDFSAHAFVQEDLQENGVLESTIYDMGLSHSFLKGLKATFDLRDHPPFDDPFGYKVSRLIAIERGYEPTFFAHHALRIG